MMSLLCLKVQDTSGENGGDSDGTVTDEQNHSKDDSQPSADDKPMSSTPKKGRQIPPLLAEWNRNVFEYHNQIK